jgi:hypothetical protein
MAKPGRQKRGFFGRNGLTLVMLGFFVLSFVGQGLAGQRHENEQRSEHGQSSLSVGEYLKTGAFLESVFENWESEFLQMAAFVIFSAFLHQRGSSQSKDPDEVSEQDLDPEAAAKPDSPYPVHRGGLLLKLYNQSLSLALLGLFVFSFAMHAVGGVRAANDEARHHGGATMTLLQYLGSSTFWFESFQNYQSEFLSVALLIWLSIFLRQKGSAESKPVHAPHHQTGD